MNPQTNTTRTDAAAYTCDCPYVQEDAVSADFARKLERELAESRAYADKLAAGLPVGMLPKDIELLRDSNAQLAARVKELEGDGAMLDWLEQWHLYLSRLTSPDMSGIRFVGQYFNPAKERGEAGPGYLRIQGPTIRDAIRSAMRGTT